MNTVQASVGLDATALKLLGVVTMTVDHIGYILCPDLVLQRILGRLAYPIFAYLIAEGCTYSKHKAKYFLAVRYWPAVLHRQLWGGTHFVSVHYDHLRLLHRLDFSPGACPGSAQPHPLGWRVHSGIDRLLFAFPVPPDSTIGNRLWLFGYHNSPVGLVG